MESPPPKKKEDRSGWRRKGVEGPWAHLDKETRLRYEEIQKRIVEKWERGEI